MLAVGQQVISPGQLGKFQRCLRLALSRCFDRIFINGYLSGLSRREQVVHFFRQIIGVPIVGKEVLTSVPMTIRTGWKLLPGTTTFSSSGPSGIGDTVDIFGGDESYNRIRSTSLSVISSFVRS